MTSSYPDFNAFMSNHRLAPLCHCAPRCQMMLDDTPDRPVGPGCCLIGSLPPALDATANLHYRLAYQNQTGTADFPDRQHGLRVLTAHGLDYLKALFLGRPACAC